MVNRGIYNTQFMVFIHFFTVLTLSELRFDCFKTQAVVLAPTDTGYKRRRGGLLFIRFVEILFFRFYIFSNFIFRKKSKMAILRPHLRRAYLFFLDDSKRTRKRTLCVVLCVSKTQKWISLCDGQEVAIWPFLRFHILTHEKLLCGKSSVF